MSKKSNIGLISVIVPAYNAEKSLYRSLDSIILQTYKNLDIIVIDDGSKDNTGKIADIYAQNDQRVRVFHVNNGGEAKSRNIGITEAKGEFIAFCDADDYMHPEMLEFMYNSVINDKSDIAVCSFNYVDENGNILDWFKPRFKSRCISSTSAQKEFLLSVNIEGFAWNKLIRKELFVNNNIKYDEDRVSYCDVVAAYRLMESAKSVSMVDRKMYDYYQLNTSCIHTPDIRKLLDYIVVLDKINILAAQSGLSNEGNIYQTYRIMKHLYGVYKDKELYDIGEMKHIYIDIYEKNLKFPLIKKIRMATKYHDEKTVKSVVKIVLVDKYYRKICKE